MSSLAEYSKQIAQALQAGNATEHTHRPALKRLVEAIAHEIGLTVTATNEPKRVSCGAPDFIVTQGQTPLGYIEAKDVDKPLNASEKDEQMERYLSGLGNLILTDYLEFRWYVGGEKRKTARLATVGRNNKLIKEPGGEEQVTELLTLFLRESVPTIGTPKELAVRMAALTHLLRDALAAAFERENATGVLHVQLASFREVLLHDLHPAGFMDMYAQTICYGLFTARCNTPLAERFDRWSSVRFLPKTNPFLKKLFGQLAGPELDDEPFVWVVENLADLLNRADIAAVLEHFGKRTQQQDPVVHFYETFLAAYDPKMREARGVYYTPEPVVSYIVRSVDQLLKTVFGLPGGLADTSKVAVPDADGTAREQHKVQILDPATGTGTFLHGVIDQIHQSLIEKGQAGIWNSYVSDHLLPRLFGFELLMAPYAVAHMKLGLQLAELGYDFHADERLRIYLTNTLDEPHHLHGTLPFAQWLAEEANAASEVKRDMPILVVLGNPPYSNFGQMNRDPWILGLLDEYKKGLHEKKLNLNDDFIKFIRWAQWRIDKTGQGILAFVTNHTYLDGITHRRMRESLLETFDEIYILDLHGNSRKGETTPEGEQDQNVFDIQQGVAIGIFVKKGAGGQTLGRLSFSELFGTRVSKYTALEGLDIASQDWHELSDVDRSSCLGQLFFFKPKAFDNIDEYCSGWDMKQIFPVSGNAIKTDRDELFVDFDKDVLRKRIQRFFSNEGLEPPFRDKYHIDNTSSYQILQRRASTTFGEDKIHRFLYRPYDLRFLYYDPLLISRPAWEVMQPLMAGWNQGLIATRQTSDQWDVLVSRDICGHKSVAAYDINTFFPLYLYPNGQPKASLFELDEPSRAPGGRRPNLTPAFVAAMEKALSLTFIPDSKGDRQATFGPEDVFDYMYAVFHAPTYRSRYAESLKIDFPRLPLTSNPELFRVLCSLGESLVAVHLLEHIPPPCTRFPVGDGNMVEQVRYSEPHGAEPGRVWINKTQYVEGVSPAVWAYHVGGYQVCEKWLKDRKGRLLSYDDLTHYQRIVAALGETIRLMGEIDRVIEAHGGWPLQ